MRERMLSDEGEGMALPLGLFIFYTDLVDVLFFPDNWPLRI